MRILALAAITVVCGATNLAQQPVRDGDALLLDDGSAKLRNELMSFSFCALLLTCTTMACSQTRPQEKHSVPDTSKPNAITINSNDHDVLDFDRGTIRFLATSKDTKGAFSVVEIKEMPGYKTALHRHPHWDEAFYVIEGVLTVKINDTINNYPAGSYVLIPRGTPHGQGNFTTAPTRVLLTFTPSAYEQFFRDRVELFKTVKPDSPEFTDRFNKLRRKHAKYVDILGTWDVVQ
jgi:quercetin dioxygenase-like cupin family protein